MVTDARELTIEEQNLLLNNRLSDTFVRTTGPHNSAFESGNRQFKPRSKSLVSNHMKYEQIETKLTDYNVETKPIDINDIKAEVKTNNEEDDEEVLVKVGAPAIDSTSKSTIKIQDDDEDDDENDMPMKAMAPSIIGSDTGIRSSVKDMANKSLDKTFKPIAHNNSNNSTDLEEEEDTILQQSVPGSNENGNSSLTHSTTVRAEIHETEKPTTTPKPWDKKPQKRIPDLINVLIVMEVTVITLLMICWFVFSIESI